LNFKNKMETIYCEKLPRILKNKKRLETALQVKITNQGQDVTIQGTPEAEYVAEKVIDALNMGFPYSISLMIKKNDFLFEIIKYVQNILFILIKASLTPQHMTYIYVIFFL